MKVLAVTQAAPVGASRSRRLDLVQQLAQHEGVVVARVHADGTLEELPGLGSRPTFEHGEPRHRFRLGEPSALNRRLAREGVSLIHALDDDAIFWAVPAARKAHARVIVSRHASRLGSAAARDVELAELTQAADGVVTDCAELVERLTLGEGLAPERVVRITPGIDLTRWDARVHSSRLHGRLTPAPGSRTVVLTCNPDEPSQHLRESLQGFALARRYHPELEAWVVNCAHRRGAHRDLVEELALQDACRFVGERQDLPLLYASALAAVFSGEEGPSLIDALEPMASACPVLLPSRSVAAPLLGHYERGAVFAEHNPAALARALRALLDDPGHARDLGREGRAYLEREHDASRWLAAIRTLYGRVLSGALWRLGGGGTYGHDASGPLPAALER